MKALDLYRAIMAAAIIAPTADQVRESEAARCWVSNQTHTTSARAWIYWQSIETANGADYTRDTAHAETMGELYEIADRSLTRKHATFTHAAGRVKLTNTRERLEGFAADMIKGAAWALWGGGEKPAETIKPRKIRANNWRPGLVKVAAEALQDGQPADFLAVAVDQLGGLAYMHVPGKPFIAYAPDYADGLPEGFAVARKCDGEWVTMHMGCGLSVGLSYGTKSKALASGLDAIEHAGPEKLAAALARNAHIKQDQAAALQAWREVRGIADVAQVMPEAADVAQVMPEAADVAQVMPEAADVAQVMPEAADVAQVMPEAADVAQVMPEAADVAQVMPEAADVAQVMPEAADVAQVMPEAADVAQVMPEAARIKAAADDLARLSATYTPDASRRLNIAAGRLGMPGALPYIREALQRIAEHGFGLEKTEARKALQNLDQVTTPEAAAAVRAVVAIAQAKTTSAQEQPQAIAAELVTSATADQHHQDRGQIQRTGDAFADYWANSASASILADYKAGRVRVVNLDKPAAPIPPHTPTDGGDDDGRPHTHTTDHTPDCTTPVETMASASDCTQPVETREHDRPDFKRINPDPENAPDLAAWHATATETPQAAEHHQDALDHINGQRLHQTRQALRAMGWSDDGNPTGWPLTYRGENLRPSFWHVGAGRNVARITWQTTDGEQIADTWSETPQQIADTLHTKACAFLSGDQFAAAAQTMTPEQCERVALHLEDINYHGEALQWRCLGAGALDLAERVDAINREHLRAGSLTWELSVRRQTVSDELKARKETMNTTHTTGAELQTLREAAGLTREALAELAHVEARTVKHWETRKGAAVPADVAAIVNDAARWVGTAARQALQQIATSDHKPAEVVLIRYREAEHMHPADRARGLRPDIHGAMLARLVLDLAADGIRPRVVWFDPEQFTNWRQALDRDTNSGKRSAPPDDTPEARAAWASWTINAGTIPHPGDQPPPGHTPGR